MCFGPSKLMAQASATSHAGPPSDMQGSSLDFNMQHHHSSGHPVAAWASPVLISLHMPAAGASLYVGRTVQPQRTSPAACWARRARGQQHFDTRDVRDLEAQQVKAYSVFVHAVQFKNMYSIWRHSMAIRRCCLCCQGVCCMFC